MGQRWDFGPDCSEFESPEDINVRSGGNKILVYPRASVWNSAEKYKA